MDLVLGENAKGGVFVLLCKKLSNCSFNWRHSVTIPKNLPFLRDHQSAASLVSSAWLNGKRIIFLSLSLISRSLILK